MSQFLLQLYPRAWRERYGEEIEMLVASEPATLRVWLDLIAGAIDARMNPQWLPATAPEGGHTTMTTFLHSCGRTEYKPEQHRQSAFLMIVMSLALVSSYFGIRAAAGDSVFSQALLFSAFNIALVIASLPTFLSNYPANVRAGLAAGGIAISYGFFLLVVLLGERL